VLRTPVFALGAAGRAHALAFPRKGAVGGPRRGATAMTKSELIDRLAAQFPQLVAKDAELAVKMVLDAMAESLAKGERIEIRGFGSFGLNYRPPRTGRNPKSGEKVQVPEKYVPHFKAGKELRERVDFNLAQD
jgi:integration host factor subunit beta